MLISDINNYVSFLLDCSMIESHVGPLSGCGFPVVIGVLIIGQERTGLARFSLTPHIASSHSCSAPG